LLARADEVIERRGPQQVDDNLADMETPPREEPVGPASPAPTFPVDQRRVFDSPIPI